MKKTLLILLFLVHSLAFAENVYISFLGGANFVEFHQHEGIKPHFQTGYLLSGAVGYEWCNGLSLEAEYAYRRTSMSKIHYFGQDFHIPGSFQSSSYMANLIWDFPIECFLSDSSLFLGGGIGYDVQQFHASQDGFRLNDNKKGFSWQWMVGLEYLLCNQTKISLEYKFHKGPLKNVYNHAIGVGLSYEIF